MALMPEDVVNNALDVMGYPKRIGSFIEGTQAAIAARDIWQETMDEALAVRPWEFARVFFTLVLSSATLPGPGWQYKYERPDVITILDVYPSALDRFNPLPGLWLEYLSEGQTTTIAADRRILTNFANARAMATARVINTALWAPEFTAVMVQSLAQKLGPLLMGGEDGARRHREQRAGRDRAPDQN